MNMKSFFFATISIMTGNKTLKYSEKKKKKKKKKINRGTVQKSFFFQASLFNVCEVRKYTEFYCKFSNLNNLLYFNTFKSNLLLWFNFITECYSFNYSFSDNLTPLWGGGG